MKRLQRAGRLASLTLSLAYPAAAADLPSAKAPPASPSPAFSWQGGYVGLNAGALLSEGAFTLVNQTPLRGSAFVGGGTFGYNW